MNITNFTQFVNAELPKRISIEVPSTGNLQANKYLITTGIGLQVRVVDEIEGSNLFIVTQPDHQLSKLNTIFHDGIQWRKARANKSDTLATHVVIEVVDINNFKIAMIGRYYMPNHGLLVGEYYFTSDVVAGGLTQDEPPRYSNPMVFTESIDYIHILPFRPSYKTDLENIGSGGMTHSLEFRKQRIVIDGAIKYLKQIPISWSPIPNTDKVIYNGLMLDEFEDYSFSNDINNKILSFQGELRGDLELGDVVIIQGIVNNGYIVTFDKVVVNVDIPFIISRQTQLGKIPVDNSMSITLNRLILQEDVDYHITGDTVYFDASLALANQDVIVIKYAVV